MQDTNPQTQTATGAEVATTSASTAKSDQGASTNADAIPLQLVAPNNYLIPPATLNKLQRSGYNIVLQVGWVQPSAQLNRTEHFHLLGGQSYPPTKDQANATTLGAQTTSAAYQNANTYQVNGDISISLNRFLISSSTYYSLSQLQLYKK